ncbi:DNA-binding response regulator [Mucilaginibacter sp. PPCGB 2223]|uniref:LytR/AlgR family response regulator transcription factor n=1 Tax=Mucilaginibacter sp. PPCGB 2223 TaxID=1886027 RepID=UPI00082610DA|nr:response regulator transcription factor [Mucilaginibacter sp. PPCGB 2223]OCX53723.1 DNA-binding response regulator [Mucilaginibacter sp. PPCGB 2223]
MAEPIKCIIVDDEPVARSIIRNYCSHLPFLNVMAEFGNALDVKAHLTTQAVDLIFLDINMPVLNGIGFMQTLKKVPLVIFTTAYEEYAVKAFDLDAIDYLLKPFSLERFIIAVDKVREKLGRSSEMKTAMTVESTRDTFFIRCENRIYQLVYDDCLFFEAQGNYTKVVTVQQQYITKTTFSALIRDLPGQAFLRVHRSFVVNRNRISHIAGGCVYIGSFEIPIASTHRAAFLRAIGIG